jgi:pyruvate-ferredoxin/flavodoxin oxidoreductase
MAYGNVYVATVALGADDNHTVKVFAEAENYDGPSLIIAFAHCIAHGIDMRMGLNHQKTAVESGHWLLYRFDPRRAVDGENPFQLDSGEPTVPLETYLMSENRFRMLQQSDPQRAAKLVELAQQAAKQRYAENVHRAAEHRS